MLGVGSIRECMKPTHVEQTCCSNPLHPSAGPGKLCTAAHLVLAGVQLNAQAGMQALQLSLEQSLQIAAMRRDHLACAKGLFQERQDISLRVGFCRALRPEPGTTGLRLE